MSAFDNVTCHMSHAHSQSQIHLLTCHIERPQLFVFQHSQYYSGQSIIFTVTVTFCQWTHSHSHSHVTHITKDHTFPVTQVTVTQFHITPTFSPVTIFTHTNFTHYITQTLHTLHTAHTHTRLHTFKRSQVDTHTITLCTHMIVVMVMELLVDVTHDTHTQYTFTVDTLQHTHTYHTSDTHITMAYTHSYMLCTVTHCPVRHIHSHTVSHSHVLNSATFSHTQTHTLSHINGVHIMNTYTLTHTPQHHTTPLPSSTSHHRLTTGRQVDHRPTGCRITRPNIVQGYHTTVHTVT